MLSFVYSGSYLAVQLIEILCIVFCLFVCVSEIMVFLWNIMEMKKSCTLDFVSVLYSVFNMSTDNLTFILKSLQIYVRTILTKILDEIASSRS